MRQALLSTALVALALGAQAQTPMPATPQPQYDMQAPQPDAMVPAFLASQFTGMTLYALENGTRPGPGAGRWTQSEPFLAERDRWESVGTISDVVMTQDGAVRGVLIDVGGFLGLFARTVMVGIEDLYFVADTAVGGTEPAGTLGDFAVIAPLTRAQLEALPEWDGAMLGAGFAQRPAGGPDGSVPPGAMDPMVTDPAQAQMQDPGVTAVPGAERHPGFTAVTEAPSAAQLIGARVYDADLAEVGTVSELRLADAQMVTGLVVDLGSQTVVLPMEGAQILWSADREETRVQLDMTRAEIEALPDDQD